MCGVWLMLMTQDSAAAQIGNNDEGGQETEFDEDYFDFDESTPAHPQSSRGMKNVQYWNFLVH